MSTPLRALGKNSPTRLARGRVETIVAFGGLVVAALTCFTTLRILYLCYNPLPWGDMWNYWAWVRSHEHDWFWHLAAQHNEHRLLVARLFFLFDQFSTGGTQLSLAIFIPLIQLAHALVFWRLAARVPGIERSIVWFLGAISMAAMFSSQQFTNFTWYFQIQFVAAYFGATLSLLALLKTASANSNRGRWLAITVALAIVTTYSMANGLLIWPLLVSLAFFLGLSRRIQVVLLASGACSFVVYFIGYVQPPKHPSPAEALSHLEVVARFFVTTIGSPFADVIASAAQRSTAEFVEGVAAIVGSFGLLAAVLIVAHALLHFRTKPGVELAYIHILIFDLGSIALIALGRFAFPIREALTSRYTTPALLFWLVLITLVVIACEKSARAQIRGAGRILQLAVLVMFVFFVVFDRAAKISYAKGYQLYLSEAEMAISNDVFDQPMWLRVNHEIPALFSLVGYLRPRHLSIFNEPGSLWMGELITRHFNVSAAEQCQGSIDRIAAIQGDGRSGYRVEGWAWDKQSQTRPRRLIFADGGGRVIGSAVSGWDRPDVAAVLHRKGSIESGWIGYVDGLHHDRIAAYAELADKRRVCQSASRETKKLE